MDMRAASVPPATRCPLLALAPPPHPLFSCPCRYVFRCQTCYSREERAQNGHSMSELSDGGLGRKALSAHTKNEDNRRQFFQLYRRMARQVPYKPLRTVTAAPPARGTGATSAYRLQTVPLALDDGFPQTRSQISWHWCCYWTFSESTKWRGFCVNETGRRGRFDSQKYKCIKKNIRAPLFRCDGVYGYSVLRL